MNTRLNRVQLSAALLSATIIFSVPASYADTRSQTSTDVSLKGQASQQKSIWLLAYEKNMERIEEMRAQRLERKSKSTTNRSLIEPRNEALANPKLDVSKKPKGIVTAFKERRAERLANRKVRLENGRNKSAPNKPITKKTKTAQNVGSKDKYGNLIAKYAAQNGVPYKLARAVVFVESSFRPNVTGAAGEIGLMQIKLSTARGMGYKGGAKKLYNPSTNLYWGMKYLGRAHQLSGGTTCGTILKYNAGHYAKRNNPVSSRYCRRVQQII